MRFIKHLSILIIFNLLFPLSFVLAEDFNNFAEIDLEELLNTEVITASRESQKLKEAPNAVYVLTAKDIKRSGQ